MNLHEAIERVSATTSSLSESARTAISLVLERMHRVDGDYGTMKFRGAPRNDMVRVAPLGGNYRDVPVCKHDSALTIGSLVLSAMEIT